MPDADLKALLERARRGDEAAFEQLYGRFEGSVYGLCRRLTGDLDAADDAAQQVWVAVWRGLGSLRQPEAFSGWLRQTVVRVCGRQQRRRRWWLAWTEAEGDASEERPEPPAEQAGADETLVRGEQAEAVQAALDRLSAEHRQVVVLHHLEGLGVAEIASLLGVATGTVKSRLGRARAHLARLLSPLAE